MLWAKTKELITKARAARARQRERLLDLLYRGDPVGRTAQDHIHPGPGNFDARRTAFLAADRLVQRRVLMELRVEIEKLSPGHAASAGAAVVGATATGLTLMVAFVLAFFNGWFGLVVKMTDSQTGIVRGLNQSDFETTLEAIGWVAFAIALTVILGGILLVEVAQSRDGKRAIAVAWLAEYSSSLDELRSAPRTRWWHKLSVQRSVHE